MEPFYRYLVRGCGVDPDSITTLEQTLPRLNQALIDSGYGNFDLVQHQFYDPSSPTIPQGITGIYFFDSQRDGLVRRPGHLTIHTWPELGIWSKPEDKSEPGSVGCDLVLAERNDLLLKNMQKRFSGDYQVLTEFGGKLSGRIPQQLGRQALAYLMGPKDRTYLNPKKVIDLLSEVSQEAKFKLAEENGIKKSLLRHNQDYLSAGVVLTTSHFIIDYLPEENMVALNAFTCTEKSKDGKTILDEGDTKLGLEKFVQAIRPDKVIYLVDVDR